MDDERLSKYLEDLDGRGMNWFDLLFASDELSWLIMQGREEEIGKE